jgi:uncharacterized protein (TIGR03067 family)
MRYCALVLILAFIATTLALAQNAPTPATLIPSDLIGTYSITASQNGGEEVPQERTAGVLVRFTQSTIVATDTEKKEVYSAKYELDTTAQPTKIFMTSTSPTTKDAKANGLIAREGNVLKLIYRLPNGTEDPTEFKTKPGQIMVVMERVKD